MTGEDLKKMKQGPIRHTGLDPFLTAWARTLFDRVGHHLYPAFEQWELGFMRDTHPEREIFVWEGIARAYEQYLTDHPETDARKLAGCMSAISMGGRFQEETEETEAMRTVFQGIWNRMIDETDVVLEQVRLTLGDKLEDD